MADPNYRYPGTKPFAIADKDIFHGREYDVEKLYDLLSMRRLLVLFAGSGMGKSSLVNAGLIPKYEQEYADKQITPIQIRFGIYDPAAIKEAGFQDKDDLLVQKVIAELLPYKERIAHLVLPFSEEPDEGSLWYQVKLLEQNGLMLLLVFDQFEELFTYSDAQVDFFKKQIYSVFTTTIPKDYDSRVSLQIGKMKAGRGQDSAESDAVLNQDLAFIYKPLNTRILFVIREDKLGMLNSFNDYFPDILKNIYKLGPLSERGAKDAILLPAQQEGVFASPQFRYTDEALNKLLDRLKDKDGHYDPFSVQLNCRYIERSLAMRGKLTIEAGQIPEDIKIVNDFLNNIWKKIAAVTSENIDSIKQTIEEKLIDFELEKRISVHEGAWLDEKVRTVMFREGLIKKESWCGVEYIELSHDRFVKPLLHDYKARRQQKELRKGQRRILLIGAIVLVCLFGGLYFLVQHYIQVRSERNKLVTAKVIAAQKSDIVALKSENEEVHMDLAETYIDLAREELEINNKEKAEKYFTSAIAAASAANDKAKMISIAKEKSKAIPAGSGMYGLRAGAVQNVSDQQAYREAQRIFRIDVFYDERTLPQSEATADSIIAALQQNPDFVIRKKRLTRRKIRTYRTWNISRNTIRHEADKNEKALADSLVGAFNQYGFINNTNKRFRRVIVRSTVKSPNYISVFIRN